MSSIKKIACLIMIILCEALVVPTNCTFAQNAPISKTDIALSKSCLDRGVVLFNKGDYKRALDQYNQAIQLNPTSAAAYGARGEVRETLGDYKGVVDDCIKVINQISLSEKNGFVLKPGGADIYG